MKINKKDGCLYLDSGYLEFYIPQYYLDHGLASVMGNKIEAMALCNYKFYNKPDTKPVKIGVFNVPSFLEIYPSDIAFGIKDSIYPTGTENEYLVLKFFGGDKICRDTTIKSLDNVMSFTDLLLAGKIDNNIPYDMITKAWIRCMLDNNVNFNVPATILELVVSELCRCRANQEKPFRKQAGKDPSTDLLSYVPTTIRNICSINSVFAALTFEDMNSMLDASLNMTAKNRKQNISPVEKIIKM